MSVQIRGDRTIEDVEAALTLLARNGGNTALTHRQLEEAGQLIPQQTLHDWMSRRHVDRYREIQTQLAPQIEQAAINSAREIITVAAQKEAQLLEALDPSQLSAKDIAGALRNVTTTKALNIDKALLPLTGRPSSFSANLNPDDIAESLAKKGLRISYDADATATEEPTSLPTATAVPSPAVGVVRSDKGATSS